MLGLFFFKSQLPGGAAKWGKKQAPCSLLAELCPCRREPTVPHARPWSPLLKRPPSPTVCP